MSGHVDTQRLEHGFLIKDELIEKIGEHNTLFDDASIMVSRNVHIGKGNIFYPNVIIEQSSEGKVRIGDNNIFYPGTFLFCTAGVIEIGSGNEFGPAGVTMKANTPNAHIQIGDNGRYCDGASIMGETNLGSGSQVLGSIAVQNCELASGDTFRDPNPDMRAAVLKGFGFARNVRLGVGDVINGSGDFTASPVERQSAYHPKVK